MGDTAVQAPPSILLSADELHAFGRLRGTPPPDLGPDPLAELDDASREAVVGSAIRGLLARRVLVAVDGAAPDQPSHSHAGTDLAIAPGVAALLDVLWSPDLVASVVASRTNVVERRWLLAQPAVTVGVRGFGGGLYEFAMLPTSELAERLLEAAGPDDGGHRASGVEGFAVARGDLRAALTRAESGDADGALRALLDAGVPATAGSAFVAAVGAAVASAGVVVHRPGEPLPDGELTWLDAGQAGLWVIPDAGESAERPDTEELHVRPATAAEIRADLTSFLPTPA